MVKKRTRNIIIGISITLIILIAIFGISQTIFGARPQLQCSAGAEDISCSVYRNTAGNLASTIFIDDEITLSLAKPSGSDERRALLISQLRTVKPCIDDFFRTHSITGSWSNPSYGGRAGDTEAGLSECFNDASIYSEDCITDRTTGECPITVRVAFDMGKLVDSFGNQIMIVDGDILEMKGDDTRNAIGTGRTTRTYGFGQWIDGSFTIKDPLPDDPERKFIFRPTSFKIKIREEGYTEADLCPEFEINCPEEEPLVIDDDSTPIDTDDDGIIDEVDTDDDGDGILDVEDETPTGEKERSKTVQALGLLMIVIMTILVAIIIFGLIRKK